MRSKLGGCEGMPHKKIFNHFLQLTQGIFSNQIDVYFTAISSVISVYAKKGKIVTPSRRMDAKGRRLPYRRAKTPI